MIWMGEIHIEVHYLFHFLDYCAINISWQFCQKFRQVQYYFCPVIKVTLVMIICGVRLHLYQFFFVLCRGTKSHISRKMPQKNCGHFNVIYMVMYFYSRATITKAFLNCRIEIHQGTATFKSYFFLLLFLAFLMNLFSTQSKIFLRSYSTYNVNQYVKSI